MAKFTAKNNNGTVYFKARLSYANVFEPRSFNGQDPKYSVSLLVSKDDKETLKVISEAIAEAKERDKDKRWKGKIPSNLRTPVRDGDEDRPDDENYTNHYFLNANADAKRPPRLLTRVKGEIATESDIYSGCYAIAIVNFYGYNTAGNQGVGCGLVGLQKFEDGERLSGGSFNEDELEFDEVEESDDDFLF